MVNKQKLNKIKVQNTLFILGVFSEVDNIQGVSKSEQVYDNSEQYLKILFNRSHILRSQKIIYRGSF